MGAPIELAEGRQIRIRALEPSDREALAQGFERLGPQSRYMRFFAPVVRLTDSQLEYLTDIDHHDHEALVAVEEQTRKGVGVARYVRIGEREAEPAIAVADDWQRRGSVRCCWMSSPIERGPRASDRSRLTCWPRTRVRWRCSSDSATPR